MEVLLSQHPDTRIPNLEDPHCIAFEHYDEVPMVGGPVEKMPFFQIAPMTKVSTQIYSSICQYDVYKVSSKKNEWKGSIGGVKVDFLGGGDEWVRF